MRRVKNIALILAMAMLISCIPAISMAATVKAPAKVSLTSVTQTGGTTVTVKWKKISTAAGYEVYRASSQTGAFIRVKTVTSNKTVSYKDTGRTVGKSYWYKVKAYKKVNGKKKYGVYSVVKKASIDYLNVHLGITMPEMLDNGTMVVTLKNNAKLNSVYINTGLNIACEDVTAEDKPTFGGQKIISYVKGGETIVPESSFAKIRILPGETITVTMTSYKDINDFARFIMDDFKAELGKEYASLMTDTVIFKEDITYDMAKTGLMMFIKYRGNMDAALSSNLIL